MLRERGLLDSSLVVFTSDHGEAFKEHGHHGHVAQVYDESIHVPLIIRDPRRGGDHEALKRRAQGPVPHIDVVPTILDLLELPPMPGQMGHSLLEGGSPEIFSETRVPVAPEDVVTLRDDAYKMIYTPSTDTFEMFDVRADPGEKEDVFESARGEREAWVQRLRDIANGVHAVERDLSPEELQRLQALGYN